MSSKLFTRPVQATPKRIAPSAKLFNNWRGHIACRRFKPIDQQQIAVAAFQAGSGRVHVLAVERAGLRLHAAFAAAGQNDGVIVGVRDNHRIGIGDQRAGDAFIAGEGSTAGIVHGHANREGQRDEADDQRQQNQAQKPQRRQRGTGL